MRGQYCGAFFTGASVFTAARIWRCELSPNHPGPHEVPRYVVKEEERKVVEVVEVVEEVVGPQESLTLTVDDPAEARREIALMAAATAYSGISTMGPRTATILNMARDFEAYLKGEGE